MIIEYLGATLSKCYIETSKDSKLSAGGLGANGRCGPLRVIMRNLIKSKPSVKLIVACHFALRSEKD